MRDDRRRLRQNLAIRVAHDIVLGPPHAVSAELGEERTELGPQALGPIQVDVGVAH